MWSSNTGVCKQQSQRLVIDPHKLNINNNNNNNNNCIALTSYEND